MTKIISWVLGLSAGTAVGVLLVALFVPETSQQVRKRLRDGYTYALQSAKSAQDAKRAELEAKLAAMQGRTLPDPNPQPQLPAPKKSKTKKK